MLPAFPPGLIIAKAAKQILWARKLYAVSVLTDFSHDSRQFFEEISSHFAREAIVGHFRIPEGANKNVWLKKLQEMPARSKHANVQIVYVKNSLKTILSMNLSSISDAYWVILDTSVIGSRKYMLGKPKRDNILILNNITLLNARNLTNMIVGTLTDLASSWNVRNTSSADCFDVVSTFKNSSDVISHIRTALGNILARDDSVHLATVTSPFLRAEPTGAAGRLDNVDTPKFRRGLRVVRVATASAAPFVSTSEAVGSECFGEGVVCLEIDSKIPDDITKAFDLFEVGVTNSSLFKPQCCYGLSISLLIQLSRDLDFEFDLYLATDGFGAKLEGGSGWSGIVGDVSTGAADLAVSALSMTKSRQEVVDFSMPYYYSSFSFVGIGYSKTLDLGAFLRPLEPKTWVCLLLLANLVALFLTLSEAVTLVGITSPNSCPGDVHTYMQPTKWFTTSWSLVFNNNHPFTVPTFINSKLVGCVWALASLIIVSEYTARHTSLFSKPEREKFTSIYDPNVSKTNVITRNIT